MIIVGILILASFLRLHKITSLPPGLYPDEAMNGNNALEAIATGDFKIFYPENNGREGLFINIQALFLKILLPLNNHEPEPWMLRLPSAIFGILTVLGIFFLAKELFKKFGLAALASFFAAISFWHINFSRIGFRAIMAPFFLTWGIYLLIKLLQKENWTRQLAGRNLALPLLGGAAYGLGFYSYIAYRSTPFLVLIIFLFYFVKSVREKQQKFFWARAGLFSLATLVIISPLVVYFIQMPQDFFGRTAQISVFSAANPLKELALNVVKTVAMFNIVGDYNWRHNISGKPLLFWPVGILFLLGAFLLIKKIIHKTLRFQFCVLISWLIVAALPVIISDEGLPHALRSLLMIPPVFIIAAFGAVWVYDKIKKRAFKNFIAVAFLFLLIGESHASYFKTWGENPEVKNAFSQNYVDIGKELNSLPKEMPKYVVVQSGGVNVRSFPMATQTVMFITNTFLPKNQREKNIYYIFPEEKIPFGSFVTRI